MAEEEKEKKPESSSEEKTEKPVAEAVAKKEDESKVAEPAKETGKEKEEAKVEEVKVEEKKPEEKTEPASEEKKEEKTEEKTETKTEESKEESKATEAKPEAEAETKKEGGEGEASESKDVKVEEKKKKGFRLPFFGKKKEEEKDEKTGDDGEEKADKSDKVSEDEALSAIEKVEEELVAKITEDVDFASDTLVLRISKSRLMLVLGVLVLLMWMIPAVKGVQILVEKSGIIAKKTAVEQESKTSEEVVKIKVRHNPNQDEITDELTDLLKDGGYDFVEIEEDETTVFEGVAVVTKSSDVETRIKIESLLTKKYKISSPSAELTDDSDFDAVVIIGKEASAE